MAGKGSNSTKGSGLDAQADSRKVMGGMAMDTSGKMPHEKSSPRPMGARGQHSGGLAHAVSHLESHPDHGKGIGMPKKC